MHFAESEVSIPLVYELDDKKDRQEDETRSTSTSRDRNKDKKGKPEVCASPQAVVLKLPKRLEII